MKKKDINSMISKMSIEEKIGQCLVIGFVGSMATPEIYRRIRKYKPAGVRVGMTMRTKTAIHDPYATSEEHASRVIRQPRGMVKDFLRGIPAPHCTNGEWCEFLNSMKQEALKNPSGIPLHITVDMEGENSADYFHDGVHFFPSSMGVAKTGDPEMAEKVSWAVGRQLTPLGISWIHSPVLDVNTNPLNPEIGTRSYSGDFDEATTFALRALEGFKKAGIITTGKHFPGRGASTQDAHGELPVINISEEELREHLIPFKALIDAGLPCIMTAHTAYPALDPSGRPATLSKKILTDLLKDELGFKGTITTDDITMGGIVAEFEVADACLEALDAGADLILFRDESNLLDEVFPKLVEAVKSGRLPESRLDDAVSRTLSVKLEYGLFNDGGIKNVAQAGSGINDPEVSDIEKTIAEKTVSVMRDNDSLLPLDPDENVLLVEQVPPIHLMVNSQKCHPGLLWENCFKYSDKIGMVETEMSFTEDDKQRVRMRLDEADTIVVTNYYYRRGSDGREFVKELQKAGKKMIVIANSPYPNIADPDYGTVILTYGNGPESMKQIAKTLYT